MLTIAIPTYNRPDKVTNTILRIVPQLTKDVTIMVLDNCSDTNVKDYLGSKLCKEVFENIRVIRHRVNIGADANFLRCFELCETPYIWMLGDDDKIEDNAISIIFNEIEKYKNVDIIGINFRSNCMDVDRPAPVFISNTKELSEKLDHFGNWLFISTTVYKTSEYCKYLNYAMWSAYAMASQVVPAMYAISNNKTFILSEKYLVSNIPEDPDKKWSNYQIALGISSLLETRIGFRNNEYKAFGEKLGYFINYYYPGDTLYSILRSVNYNIDLIDNYHVYIFRQLIMKTFEFKTRKVSQFIQYYICLFLLKNAWALKLTWRFVPRLRKCASEAVQFNLFQR